VIGVAGRLARNRGGTPPGRNYLPDMGNKILIAALSGLLVLSGLAAYVGWNLAAPETEMSVHGYVAMALGIFFSLAIGVGLMSLVFYSSRMGYDDEAAKDHHAEGHGEPPAARFS
jgi:hypothetical protein